MNTPHIGSFETAQKRTRAGDSGHTGLCGNPSEAKHVSLCIVGIGGHGRGQISQFLRSPNRWTIAGVVDRSIAAYMRLKSMHPDLDIPYFRELSDAFDAVDADATLISTHAPSHIAIAKEVVSRNFSKHLLIEKPISNSVAQAESLIEFIRTHGWRGRVAVDFSRRCSEFYNRTRNIVASGEMGALVGIDFLRPCKLAMKGAHYIDLANWFADSPPVSVTAQLEETSIVDKRGSLYFDPPGLVEVNYANGLVFRMDTRDGQREPFGTTFRLERGTLFIDDDELFLTIQTESGSERVPGDRYNDAYNWMENTVAALVDDNSSLVPCSIEQAVDSLAVLVAAHISHRNGGERVRLPLKQSEKTTILRIT
jgi:predicted dehydrogenase